MTNELRLIDRLFDFLEDSENMTAEEVKTELEAEGIDVEKILKRARIVIKHMVKQASGVRIYADFRSKYDRDYFNSLSKEELVEICFYLSRDTARLRWELPSGVWFGPYMIFNTPEKGGTGKFPVIYRLLQRLLQRYCHPSGLL